MPRIHAPEVARALRRRYGVRGAEIADTISPEIVPVVIADALPPATGTPAAGAAHVDPFVHPPHVMLEARGEVLIAVERLTITWEPSGPSNPPVRVFRPAVPWISGGTPGSYAWRDARIPGQPSARVLYWLDTPWPGTELALVRVQPAVPFELQVGVLLQSGETSSQLIVAGAMPGALTVSFQWTETWTTPGRVP